MFAVESEHCSTVVLMRFFQCGLCFVVRYDPFLQPLKYSSRAQKEKERMEIGLCKYFKDNFVPILF